MKEKLLKRIEFLKSLPAKNDEDFNALLEKNGFSRRDFLKYSGAMALLLGLPATCTPLVAQTIELSNRIPLIWLHMAECTGCSESLLRSSTPSIDSLIFDYISLEYHETIMAASGHLADENLENALKKHKNNYILMVEGAIPVANDGYYLTIGANAHTGLDIVKNACDSAKAIFAIGSCSSFGGIQAANPNPTNAKPLHKVTSKKVINIPGCPPSEQNIVGNVMHYILYGTLPALDAYNRPKWAYGMRIHDLCERRGHFDAGEFVESFGDEGAKKGYCLYKVGCKGPYTFNNCSKLRFNQHTSWPIGAGHGCIGCSEPDFWDNMATFEKPLSGKPYNTAFSGMGADALSDKIGLGILGITGVAIAAHAVIASMQKDKKDNA